MVAGVAVVAGEYRNLHLHWETYGCWGCGGRKEYRDVYAAKHGATKEQKKN